MDIDYLEAIRLYGSAMADAADEAGPELPIPTCPGWLMRDLVRHTGELHRWATGIVGEPRAEAWNASPQDIVGEWPEDDELVAWFRHGVSEMSDVLATAREDLACWTFMEAPTPKIFWTRRQAHELKIHSADAVLPLGGIPVADARLAADGIDELLVASLTRRGRGPRSDPPRTLAVETSDTADRWMCSFESDRFTSSRVAGIEGADCTVRGSASDLDLFLWNRIGRSSIEVTGDERLLDIWHASAQR